jgi:hypothetical protein
VAQVFREQEGVISGRGAGSAVAAAVCATIPTVRGRAKMLAFARVCSHAVRGMQQVVSMACTGVRGSWGREGRAF